MYLLEDHRLIYSAGHNIVLYNTEDKSQYFFPGKQITIVFKLFTYSNVTL